MTTEDRKSFVAAAASQHGERIRQFLSRRLRNRTEVPDLVQEVYLRLLRMERHEEIRSPEAYLVTIATHLLREHKLRQASLPPVGDIKEILNELHSRTEDDPSVIVNSQQRLRVLEQALGRLSPKAQAVLLLHWRDGLSLEEIGRRLGLSRSMAKKYLAQAISHCRERLERLDRR